MFPPGLMIGWTVGAAGRTSSGGGMLMTAGSDIPVLFV